MSYPCSPRRDLSNAPNSSSNGGRTRKLRRFPSWLPSLGGTPLGSTLERVTPLIYVSRDLWPRDRLWSHYFGPNQQVPKGKENLNFQSREVRSCSEAWAPLYVRSAVPQEGLATGTPSL